MDIEKIEFLNGLAKRFREYADWVDEKGQHRTAIALRKQAETAEEVAAGAYVGEVV